MLLHLPTCFKVSRLYAAVPSSHASTRQQSWARGSSSSRSHASCWNGGSCRRHASGNRAVLYPKRWNRRPHVAASLSSSAALDSRRCLSVAARGRASTSLLRERHNQGGIR